MPTRRLYKLCSLYVDGHILCLAICVGTLQKKELKLVLNIHDQNFIGKLTRSWVEFVMKCDAYSSSGACTYVR